MNSRTFRSSGILTWTSCPSSLECLRLRVSRRRAAEWYPDLDFSSIKPRVLEVEGKQEEGTDREEARSMKKWPRRGMVQ